MNTRSTALVVGLAILVSALTVDGPAAAEIFRWTDANGQLHFTYDLNQVPAGKRAAAKLAADAPPSDRMQTYKAPKRAQRSGPASPAPNDLAKTSAFVIPVQRAGSALLVQVRINDQVTAPFYIDTGASDVIVPESLAQELGLDDKGRSKMYQTANGIVVQRAVTLESVALGSARVESVPASVSRSVEVGLLGLSFFNHFHYSVDPAQGVVRLERNELAATGMIRGGRSESQWRSEFLNVRARMEFVHESKRKTPESRSRAHARHEHALRELDREQRLLEDEADAARVPFSWRE